MYSEKAIEGVKEGKIAYRAGWNGKGMFIFLFSESPFCTKDADSWDYHIEDGYEPIAHIGFDFNNEFYPIGDFILLKTAKGNCIPWVMSQEDILADDWEVSKQNVKRETNKNG